ncbi:hypothetical protein BHECKSOX_2324 [Bathymodiolus heckerae thiotrophic gill symbiont]|nr:hypothetical protein BHECKSOX_2324 [Bathymodiolus heckerae thiotrophic gill symbiont]
MKNKTGDKKGGIGVNQHLIFSTHQHRLLPRDNSILLILMYLKDAKLETFAETGKFTMLIYKYK